MLWDVDYIRLGKVRMEHEFPVLIADIGGTNAKFGLVLTVAGWTSLAIARTEIFNHSKR